MVLTTGNVGSDLDGGHDIAYERIMSECQCWREDSRPLFLPEDSSEVARWPVFAEKVKIWMESARQIAVGGYKKVLENGPDRCSSESDSENSDHGEMWSYESTYTPEMLGPDGKPKNGGPPRARFSKAHHTGCATAAGSLGAHQPGLVKFHEEVGSTGS
jgi:hypothetical protein